MSSAELDSTCLVPNPKPFSVCETSCMFWRHVCFWNSSSLIPNFHLQFSQAWFLYLLTLSLPTQTPSLSSLENKGLKTTLPLKHAFPSPGKLAGSSESMELRSSSESLYTLAKKPCKNLPVLKGFEMWEVKRCSEMLPQGASFLYSQLHSLQAWDTQNEFPNLVSQERHPVNNSPPRCWLLSGA